MRINRELAENISALLTVKGVQYLLSFITFPYLVRVLHVDGFGQLAFVTGVTQYFLLVSNFGFDLSAPKSIARHDRGLKRGFYFSSIMAAKLLILLVLTVMFGIFLLGLAYWSSEPILLYVAVYANVVGTALFPVWFFQGIQKMRYITIVSTIGKIVSVSGIFLFVAGPEDIVTAGLFQSVGNLVAAVFSWWIIFKEYPDICMPVRFRHIKAAIVDSVPYFGTMVAINVYTVSTTVLLGLVTSAYIVGLYSAANRIIDAFRGGLSLIVDGLYPFIMKTAKESKEYALTVLHKAFIVLISFTAALCVLICIFADVIAYYILGPGYKEAVTILRILSFLPLIVIASNVYGLFGMISFGYQKQFSTILTQSAVVNLVIVFPLLYLFEAEGAAFAMMVTEGYVLYRCVRFVNRSDIRFL